MDILKLSQPNAFVVSLRGKCEGEQGAKQLVDLLREATQKQAGTLWLLCQELTSVDFRAQQTLLRHLPFLQDARVKLTLCGLQPAVQRQFEASGLSTLISLLPAEAYKGPRPILR
ncbi:STAS domain-containing protein [Hymenobacter cellulosivorans]|uniref:STAS domain-containing protein n=1 Tax=Hymenobacter cellulosivorans TaxID=2932249 RepID=A0ABY4FAB2_9BACT|nr:STAS domain-containing protein [Hymenobacter cellulosivorans]UOQ53605.1 STAS domain-containing protein [Hymenobacter cellulosivorans]